MKSHRGDTVRGAEQPASGACSCSVRERSDSTSSSRRWLVAGSLDASSVDHFLGITMARRPPPGGTLELDLSELSRIDTAGAAALLEHWFAGRDGGYEVTLRHVPPLAHRFLAHYHLAPEAAGPEPPEGALEALGGAALRAWSAFVDFLYLSADVTAETLLSLARPWRLRWSAIVEESIAVGSRALGIVALIMFLVGLVLAFQSAAQLREFGAGIYVATLTAISVVCEMGPLITAILVAGRSGSAIASEVATMRVNEEVDAMDVMGISFVSYVAVPKMIALATMVPLLVLMADVMGILGGWVVGVTYLKLGSTPYFLETVDSIVFQDVVEGIIKSVTFAWGVGLLGLFHGFRVQGGAQEVGRATTDSVVSAIFFIIVADAVFSILFYVVT